MARIIKGPAVPVPNEIKGMLRSLRRAARVVNLRWPSVVVTMHEWLRHGRVEIFGVASVCRSECRVALRSDDGQPEHTLLHEVVHGIVHPVYPWRPEHDEHPPVYWAVHGMLYKAFIDGR